MAADNDGGSAPSFQNLETENFFYFFLRLRKGEIRRTVQGLKTHYPHETPHQLANRLIEAQAVLSFLGGSLLQLPTLLPGIGQALQFLGFAGGTAVLTRMHLYLILEIALVFGKDIDDPARVPEMMTVVAATGLAPGVSIALQALQMTPIVAFPAGVIATIGVSRLIGETAICHYSGTFDEVEGQPEPLVLPSS